MLERLVSPVTQVEGVQSTTLFEPDGFVVFRSSEDQTNETPQMQRWVQALKEMDGEERITLVMEGGTIILQRGKRLHFLVHCSARANLGHIRQALDECVQNLHNMERSN
ncbi:MAG: hypothetical protein L7S56_06480 [Candidatus Poseidonia sp.]|nr:hypothetical protein [Poseidonia sp.]